MKIEIEKSEYDRLKSREEKLMAYYEWFVDKENDLVTVEDIVTENIKLKEEIKELYKSNESLYNNVKYFDHRLCDIDSKLISKQEENKKLNIKVASLEGEIKGLNYTIDKLREENQTLELWLDNKEKLNEEYRKQIDKYKRQYQHSLGGDDELIYEEGLYD